jgi:hypothetical protein
VKRLEVVKRQSSSPIASHFHHGRGWRHVLDVKAIANLIQIVF